MGKKGHFIKTSLIYIALSLLCVSMTVHADMGPKPSVQIKFKGLGDELCYGTLLSKDISTGPSTAWDGTEADARHNENENYSYENLDYETWKAFVDYEDADGYYFLQEGWQVNETKELDWVYYPPSTFKILLYYPETTTFVVSDVYERYAFDSYFTVNMSDFQKPGIIESEESDVAQESIVIEEKIEAEKSYDYSKEIYLLIIRILATIFIEMVIALLFGFTRKKELLLLAGVNIVTQVILNVLLNVIHYKMGSMAYAGGYIFFEMIVFAIEAGIYSVFLRKLSDKLRRKRFYICYAFVANLVSFAVGYFVAK